MNSCIRQGPPIFDAHCDTVKKVMDGKVDFVTGEGSAHTTLPGMRSAGSVAQVFACCAVSQFYDGRELETAERMISNIKGMIDSSAGALRLALTASDAAAGLDGGPISAIISLEGADPLEGNAEALQKFYNWGVRSIIPAWSDNAFSGTSFGSNTPLTSEGRDLVELSEELDVVIDVSHLSDTAFDDVCEMTRKPFIASHSNCRTVCASKRNLTDRMIRQLASQGGVMGLNLAPGFLDPELHRQTSKGSKRFFSDDCSEDEKAKLLQEWSDAPRPSIDWAIRHVMHAIDIGGEDCIGIGGDLDGIMKTPQRIEGIADYPILFELFEEAGLSSSQIEKIAYRNFFRVFTEGLPT